MTPAVAGESVYVGSCAGVYYAFDLVTGAIRWQHDFGEDAGHATFHGDPLITDRLVITGTESLQPVLTRALDRVGGHVVWQQSEEWALTRSDILGVGSLAIGRNDRGALVALDADAGTPVWRVPYAGERYRPDVAESPASDGETVYFSAPDGAIYRVDARSGTVRWRTPVRCDVSTSILVLHGNVHAGCRDGTFIVLHDDGAVGRRVELGHTMEGRLLPTEHGVVVPGGQALIAAIDPASGRTVWERSDLGLLTVVQPVEWQGVVLTGNARGIVVALDPASGRTRWSVRLEGNIRGLGTHANWLFVGTIQGRIYALRR